MIFEYSSYFRVCFAIPFFTSLFTICISVMGIVSAAIDISQRKNVAKSIVLILFVILIWTVFVTRDIGNVVYGGIHLIYEREDDAVETQGTIESIRPLSERDFPRTDLYEELVSNGVQFVIDGIPYSAFSRGNFEVGNQVCVSYLPKSSYILSITQVP